MSKPVMKKLHPAGWAISLVAVSASAALAMPSFGDWGAPVDIESIPGSSLELNGESIDGCSSISPDGLTLAFNSFRTGNQEIYLATRTSTAEGFGDPVMLPAPINGPGIDSCPTIVRGGELYFTSNRGDPGDIFVSRLGPKGWSEPERLGPAVNKVGTVEESASIYEDDQGREVIVFSRRPAGPLVGPGGKIYQSIDGAPATLVADGPHSSSSDNRPSVTHDGRTIFWDSLRSGTLGVWYATRSNTSEPFGQANHLSQIGPAIRPFVSWNGEILVVGKANDTQFSTREKVSGN
jgi:hypothetical protein